MNTLNQVIELYKSTLNTNSKWYGSDLHTFISIAGTKTERELKQQLANLRAITGNDAKVNKVIAMEQNKMLKAGMYNVGNMKPKNALD